MRKRNTELEADWATEIPGYTPEIIATTALAAPAAIATASLLSGTGIGMTIARGAAYLAGAGLSGGTGKVIGESIREATGKSVSGKEKLSKETVDEKFFSGAIANMAGEAAFFGAGKLLKGARHAFGYVSNFIAGLRGMGDVVGERPLTAAASQTGEILDTFKHAGEVLDKSKKIAEEAYTASVTNAKNEYQVASHGIREKEYKSLEVLEETMREQEKLHKDTKEAWLKTLEKTKKKDKEKLGKDIQEGIKTKEAKALEIKTKGKEKIEEKVKLKEAELAAQESAVKAEVKAEEEAFIEANSIAARDTTTTTFPQSVQQTLSDGWAQVEKDLSNPIEETFNGKKYYAPAPLDTKLPPDAGIMYAQDADGVWKAMPDLDAVGNPRTLIEAVEDKMDEVGLDEMSLAAGKITETELKVGRVATNVKNILKLLSSNGEVVARASKLLLTNAPDEVAMILSEEFKGFTLEMAERMVTEITSMPKMYLPFLAKGDTYGALFKLSSHLKVYGSDGGFAAGLGDIAQVIDSRLMLNQQIRDPLKMRNNAYRETVGLYHKVKGEIREKGALWFLKLHNDPLKAKEFEIYLNELEKRVYENYGKSDVKGIAQVKKLFNDARVVNTRVGELNQQLIKVKENTDVYFAKWEKASKEVDELYKNTIAGIRKEGKVFKTGEERALDEVMGLEADKIKREFTFDNQVWGDKKSFVKREAGAEEAKAKALFEAKKSEAERLHKLATDGINEQKRIVNELEAKIGEKNALTNKMASASNDGQIISNVASLNATRRSVAIVSAMLGKGGAKAARTVSFWNLKSMAANEAIMLPYEMVAKDSVLKVKTPLGNKMSKVVVTAKDTIVGYETAFAPKAEYQGMGNTAQRTKNVLSAVKEMGFSDTAKAFLGFRTAMGNEFAKMKNLKTIAKELEWSNTLNDGSVEGLNRLMKEFETVVDEIYGKGASEKFYKNEFNNLQIRKLGQRTATGVIYKHIADAIKIRRRIGEWGVNALEERKAIDQQIDIYEKQVMQGGMRQ